MIHFIRRIPKKSLQGIALMRVDFNTEDDWRMKAVLPTIEFLLKNSEKVIILSHLGRPNGFDKSLSLRKHGSKLKNFLRKKVSFFPNFRFKAIKREIKNSPRGSIFLLENLRFLKGEAKNSEKLARNLASLGDFYVNDAFAVSHRANASIDAITKFLPSFAGLIMEKELENLTRVIKNPQKPLVMIFGGAKGHDKLKVIKYFKNKADSFILGGAPANTVLKLKGVYVGRSVIDSNPGPEVKEIADYRNLVLPIDYVIHSEKILDIGKKTIELFREKLKRARTIIWNGPFGVIEKKRFKKGTLEIGKAIAKNRRAFSLVGGGETVMFLKKYGLDKKFNFISTGGGAMLDFLSGKKLPGIEALKKSQ